MYLGVFLNNQLNNRDFAKAPLFFISDFNLIGNYKQ